MWCYTYEFYGVSSGRRPVFSFTLHAGWMNCNLLVRCQFIHIEPAVCGGF
ncbi:hypothetical protein GWL_33480 [Herbaspirillum sp. GW103]|nr:hypothetical protein GWL_33480 [Herbaspirillum sp. GW103]